MCEIFSAYSHKSSHCAMFSKLKISVDCFCDETVKGLLCPDCVVSLLVYFKIDEKVRRPHVSICLLINHQTSEFQLMG